VSEIQKIVISAYWKGVWERLTTTSSIDYLKFYEFSFVFLKNWEFDEKPNALFALIIPTLSFILSGECLLWRSCWKQGIWDRSDSQALGTLDQDKGVKSRTLFTSDLDILCRRESPIVHVEPVISRYSWWHSGHGDYNQNNYKYWLHKNIFEMIDRTSNLQMSNAWLSLSIAFSALRLIFISRICMIYTIYCFTISINSETLPTNLTSINHP
jgi:hypothetical protein